MPALGSEKQTVTNPIFVKERKDVNQQKYWIIEKHKKKQKQNMQVDNELDFEFPVHRSIDFVKEHEGGYQNKGNIDIFKHYLRLYKKNKFKLKNIKQDKLAYQEQQQRKDQQIQDYNQKMKRISQTFLQSSQSPKNNQQIEAQLTKPSFKLQEFIISSNLMDLKLYQKVVDLYCFNLNQRNNDPKNYTNQSFNNGQPSLLQKLLFEQKLQHKLNVIAIKSSDLPERETQHEIDILQVEDIFIHQILQSIQRKGANHLAKQDLQDFNKIVGLRIKQLKQMKLELQLEQLLDIKRKIKQKRDEQNNTSFSTFFEEYKKKQQMNHINDNYEETKLNQQIDSEDKYKQDNKFQQYSHNELKYKFSVPNQDIDNQQFGYSQQQQLYNNNNSFLYKINQLSQFKQFSDKNIEGQKQQQQLRNIDEQNNGENSNINSQQDYYKQQQLLKDQMSSLQYERNRLDNPFLQMSSEDYKINGESGLNNESNLQNNFEHNDQDNQSGFYKNKQDQMDQYMKQQEELIKQQQESAEEDLRQANLQLQILQQKQKETRQSILPEDRVRLMAQLTDKIFQKQRQKLEQLYHDKPELLQQFLERHKQVEQIIQQKQTSIESSLSIDQKLEDRNSIQQIYKKKNFLINYADVKQQQQVEQLPNLQQQSNNNNNQIQQQQLQLNTEVKKDITQEFSELSQGGKATTDTDKDFLNELLLENSDLEKELELLLITPPEQLLQDNQSASTSQSNDNTQIVQILNKISNQINQQTQKIDVKIEQEIKQLEEKAQQLINKKEQSNLQQKLLQQQIKEAQQYLQQGKMINSHVNSEQQTLQINQNSGVTLLTPKTPSKPPINNVIIQDVLGINLDDNYPKATIPQEIQQQQYSQGQNVAKLETPNNKVNTLSDNLAKQKINISSRNNRNNNNNEQQINKQNITKISSQNSRNDSKNELRQIKLPTQQSEDSTNRIQEEQGLLSQKEKLLQQGKHSSTPTSKIQTNLASKLLEKKMTSDFNYLDKQLPEEDERVKRDNLKNQDIKKRRLIMIEAYGDQNIMDIMENEITDEMILNAKTVIHEREEERKRNIGGLVGKKFDLDVNKQAEEDEELKMLEGLLQEHKSKNQKIFKKIEKKVLKDRNIKNFTRERKLSQRESNLSIDDEELISNIKNYIGRPVSVQARKNLKNMNKIQLKNLLLDLKKEYQQQQVKSQQNNQKNEKDKIEQIFKQKLNLIQEESNDNKLNNESIQQDIHQQQNDLDVNHKIQQDNNQQKEPIISSEENYTIKLSQENQQQIKIITADQPDLKSITATPKIEESQQSVEIQSSNVQENISNSKESQLQIKEFDQQSIEGVKSEDDDQTPRSLQNLIENEIKDIEIMNEEDNEKLQEIMQHLESTSDQKESNAKQLTNEEKAKIAKEILIKQKKEKIIKEKKLAIKIQKKKVKAEQQRPSINQINNEVQAEPKQKKNKKQEERPSKIGSDITDLAQQDEIRSRQKSKVKKQENQDDGDDDQQEISEEKKIIKKLKFKQGDSNLPQNGSADNQPPSSRTQDSTNKLNPNNQGPNNNLVVPSPQRQKKKLANQNQLQNPTSKSSITSIRQSRLSNDSYDQEYEEDDGEDQQQQEFQGRQVNQGNRKKSKIFQQIIEQKNILSKVNKKLTKKGGKKQQQNQQAQEEIDEVEEDEKLKQIQIEKEKFQNALQDLKKNNWKEELKQLMNRNISLQQMKIEIDNLIEKLQKDNDEEVKMKIEIYNLRKDELLKLAEELQHKIEMMIFQLPDCQEVKQQFFDNRHRYIKDIMNDNRLKFTPAIQILQNSNNSVFGEIGGLELGEQEMNKILQFAHLNSNIRMACDRINLFKKDTKFFNRISQIFNENDYMLRQLSLEEQIFPEYQSVQYLPTLQKGLCSDLQINHKIAKSQEDIHVDMLCKLKQIKVQNPQGFKQLFQKHQQIKDNNDVLQALNYTFVKDQQDDFENMKKTKQNYYFTKQYAKLPLIKQANLSTSLSSVSLNHKGKKF